MDTQLDEIVIRHQLIPLKDKFLIELQEKIYQNKKENWLEIYLAIFIMNCNVEWILKDVVTYTARHGILVRCLLVSLLRSC